MIRRICQFRNILSVPMSRWKLASSGIRLKWKYPKLLLMIIHYLVQPFVSKQETRNAGKRSLAEHFCGQAFEGLQCRADRRVRSVDQWCQQRLGYILLGHRYQANTSSIRYRNNASAKGARQKSWKSAKDKAAGFVNIINYIIYISIQNNVLNECVILLLILKRPMTWTCILPGI